MKLPNRVVIVGGTHGNEWTGIKLIEHYQEQLKMKFSSLKLEFILANPEAYKLNKRFKDEDLNRAFEFLNENRATYENQRAREIKSIIDEEECFLIDLHTTTSNMGSTVILTHYNFLNLHIASHLTEKFKNCRVIGSPDPKRKYLSSQSNLGMMIEVGPVANGVVAGVPLESSLNLVEHILEVISGQIDRSSGEVEIYEETENVFYPQSENGKLTAYIHPDFQGKDFQKIEGDYIPFKTFDGMEMKMKATEPQYPIFINEAAYYPSKLAFTLCRKKMMEFKA